MNGSWGFLTVGGRNIAILAVAVLNVFCEVATATPLGTAFTYQGQLKEGGVPVDGPVNFVFRLFDDPAAGSQVGADVVRNGVVVSNGLFAVDLDFGAAAFNGEARWLSVTVDGTPLVSRQPITPTPYALKVPGVDGHSLDAVDGSPTDAVFVDHIGNVGIGTTAPAGQLDVVGDILLEGYGGARSFIGREAEGTSAAPTRVLGGAALAAFGGAGYDGAAFSIPQGLMRIRSAEPWTTTARGADIDFFTTPAGSTTRFQRMLITNAGNVGIGTDDPTGFKLAVNGTAAKPGGGTWAVFSDRRVKKNIEPLKGALDRALRLNGVTFEYTEEGMRTGLALPGPQMGLIAQEVEEVFPEWVSESTNGYKYVSERGTTALLVEALRELRGEKDAQITALRAENDEMRTRLERLEAMLFVKHADPIEMEGQKP